MSVRVRPALPSAHSLPGECGVDDFPIRRGAAPAIWHFGQGKGDEAVAPSIHASMMRMMPLLRACMKLASWRDGRTNDGTSHRILNKPS